MTLHCTHLNIICACRTVQPVWYAWRALVRRMTAIRWITSPQDPRANIVKARQMGPSARKMAVIYTPVEACRNKTKQISWRRGIQRLHKRRNQSFPNAGALIAWNTYAPRSPFALRDRHLLRLPCDVCYWDPAIDIFKLAVLVFPLLHIRLSPQTKSRDVSQEGE